MRQILLLTYAFPPDNTASAARPGQLFDYLPSHGYKPVVFAAANGTGSETRPFVFRAPAGRPTLKISALSTLGRWFTRFCAPYEDRLSWVPHVSFAAAEFLKSHPVGAIYSTSPSLGAHFAALYLKTKFNLPWIADFQDPICDNPFRTRKWIYPYDSLIESNFFRHANHLIANTDTTTAAWQKRYPQYAEKISVLWNSFDPKEIIDSLDAPARSYRVLAHVGGMYGGRHPGVLLSALDRLGNALPSIRVKLVGPIAANLLAEHKLSFERSSARGSLEYNNCLVPRETANREAAQADYLLLLDLNEKNAAFQVPSKLLDYIRIGKPIMAFTPHESPVERILAQSGIPYVAIDPSNAQPTVDEKIIRFFGFPPQKHKASTWFEETFNARSQAATVAEVLRSLTDLSENTSRRNGAPS